MISFEPIVFLQPMSSHTGKIAIFIDGPNLHATTKSLGFDVDYKLLVREFESRGALVRALYYAVLAEDQEFSILRPLVDWLDYNGYAVVTKPTKEFIDASGRRKVKANMDVERGTITTANRVTFVSLPDRNDGDPAPPAVEKAPRTRRATIGLPGRDGSGHANIASP